MTDQPTTFDSNAEPENYENVVTGEEESVELSKDQTPEVDTDEEA